MCLTNYDDLLYNNTLHLAHGLDREVEDHGFLDPLVDFPFAFGEVYGFCGAEFAFVHQFDDLPHGLLRGGVLEQCAVVPRLLDYRFEFVIHGLLLFSKAKVTENIEFFITLPRSSPKRFNI